MLAIIEEILAELGCASVTIATTVDQAVALSNARVFDVAMLDVILDDEESTPVADALAARGVPFVFSTGHGAHAIGNNHRYRPMLRKPYRFEELVDIFTRLLNG